MKIEKIHSNKIKVTFSPEDLIEHNITPDAVRTNAPWVQRILTNIVRKAWEEVGFQGEESRLMVEAMPGEDDTLIMYITRLENDEDLREAMHNVKRKVKLRVKPTENKVVNKVCITFSDFEDAIRLARDFKDVNEGELYFYDSKYHLIVSGEAPAMFSEFGKTSIDEKVCHIVTEHGKKISDNALEKLRKHFN